MSPFFTAVIVFLCILASTWLGLLLRERLPDHHLSADSKDVVRLGSGMIATMAALILGLMTASAKSAFDAEDAAVKQVSTNLLSLDRSLANYGPDTKELRGVLRHMVQLRLEMTWPEERGQDARVDAPEATPLAEGIERQIVNLPEQTAEQRAYKSQALALAGQLLQTRWAVFGAQQSSIPTSFLVIVVFWLSVIFASFGLFAPRNPTVVVVLVVCALSVAASMFLILEMDRPFSGMMKVSSAPFRFTLAHLGQ